MVTDRVIIASNGNTSLELTRKPYYVKETSGFDTLDVQTVMSQGFDQDGASLLNSYVLPRSMEIKGQIRAKTTNQMQDMRDRILNLFLPKKTVIINHYYGGRNRTISVVVEKTPKFKFEKVSGVQTYTVSMTAPKPYWSDIKESLVQVANMTGGFKFPLTIPQDKGVTFGIKSSSLIANVYNSSAIKVGMRFVFIANGQVTNPQLFNVNNREFFKLNCSMEAGEQITVITGEDKTVTRKAKGIESDYMGKIDLAGGGYSFLELEPGDNLFRYAADAGEDLLEVRICFTNKYAGV